MEKTQKQHFHFSLIAHMEKALLIGNDNLLVSRLSGMYSNQRVCRTGESHSILLLEIQKELHGNPGGTPNTGERRTRKRIGVCRFCLGYGESRLRGCCTLRSRDLLQEICGERLYIWNSHLPAFLLLVLFPKISSAFCSRLFLEARSEARRWRSTSCWPKSSSVNSASPLGTVFF